MSEIEKLYQNAGIIRRRKCEFYKECPLGFGHSCDDCDIEYRESNSSYPPFTAEKQLDLIKLLCGLKDFTFEAEVSKGVYYVGCREAGSNNKHWGSHNVFKEALAEVINDLWQDLTEEERKQIKGILN